MVVECGVVAVGAFVEDGCPPKESWAIPPNRKTAAAAKPKERYDFQFTIPFTAELILQPN